MAEPVKMISGVAQYFVDDSLIAGKQKVVRRWLPAKIYPYPVIEPDRPWEQRILAFFGTVVEQPGGYRIYYTNWSPQHGHSMVFVAESEDGFRWRKPELGIVEWRGSKANNIVLAPGRYNDGPSLMVDRDDAEHPYRLVSFEAERLTGVYKPDSNWGIYGYGSRDGLHWQPTDPALCLRAGDRTNIMATKADGKYRMYTRDKDHMFEHCGVRAVYLSESDDFKSWSEPELVLAPDLIDEPDVEYYGMSVFERNGWFFGLLERWRSSVDTIDVHLVFSRDGRNWEHPYPREPFIAATYDWNRKWSSCASNGPIIIGEQMVFYFGGRFVSHHYDTAQQYGAIGYASLPIDRFCAIEAAAGGQFTTNALIWPGGDLLLNADTRESFDGHPGVCDGEIAVEVLDAEGKPIPEWSGERRAIFRGNTHARCGTHGGTIQWPEGRSLAALGGRAVRLRFLMRHARVFTITAKTEE